MSPELARSWPGNGNLALMFVRITAENEIDDQHDIMSVFLNKWNEMWEAPLYQACHVTLQESTIASQTSVKCRIPYRGGDHAPVR